MPGVLTVGVLVAEGSARARADELAEDLPGALAADFPGSDWRVEVDEVQPAEPTASAGELLQTVRRRLLDEGWSVAVGLTALPLHCARRPVAARASATQSVGLVSLPALGAVDLRRRLGRTVRHLVEGLLGESAGAGDDAGDRNARHRRMLGRLRELASPLGDPRARDDGRLSFAGAVLRGNVRLLVGMVRANEPTTVVMRLSRAMLGALGTGAFALTSVNVWMIGDAMSPWRLLALLALSVAVTCVALVAAHDLWERVPSPAARERVMLLNLATVVTLAIGVLSLYVALFVILALAAGVFVPPDLLGKNLRHAAGAGDYLRLAWCAASVAMVGGALGSLVVSDDAVREAAYRAPSDERIEGDRR
jgi:uncharacterized membrane protein